MDKVFEVIEQIVYGLFFVFIVIMAIQWIRELIKGKINFDMKALLKFIGIIVVFGLSIYTIFDITDSNSVQFISKIVCVAIYVCVLISLFHYESQISQYKTIRIPHDSPFSKTCSLLSDIREKDGCTEEDAINHAARFYSKELDLKTEISKQFTNYDTRSGDIYNHLISLDNTEKRMFVMKLPLEYQKDILHRLIAEEKI